MLRRKKTNSTNIASLIIIFTLLSIILSLIVGYILIKISFNPVDAFISSILFSVILSSLVTTLIKEGV